MPPDTPQTPQSSQSPYGNETVDSLAGRIKQAYPTYSQIDNRELVQRVIGKYPVYQTALSNEEFQRLASPPTSGQPKGVWESLKALGAGVYGFGKANVQAVATPPQTPEEQALGVAGPGYGAYGSNPLALWAYRMGVAPGEAERAAAGEAAQRGDIPGVIEHSARAATSYLTPAAIASPAAGFWPVFAPQMAGVAAGQVGQGDIPGGATTAVAGLVAPQVLGRAFKPVRAADAVRTEVDAQLNTPTPSAPRTVLPPTSTEVTGTSTQAGVATAPLTSRAPAPVSFETMEPQKPTAAIETPQQAAVTPTPQAGPADHIATAGLVHKGELVPGSDVHMLEHPDYPGLTAAANGREITSPDAAKEIMARKLGQFADRPIKVTGTPALDPIALQNAARGLREGPESLIPNAPAQAAPIPPPIVAPEPFRAFDIEHFHNQMTSVDRAEDNLSSPNLTERQRGNWTAALQNLRDSFKSSISDFAQRLDPDVRKDVLEKLNAEAERIPTQIEALREARRQDETAKAMRQEMAVRPIRPWRAGTLELMGTEEGAQFQEIGRTFPGELRDEFHRILGDKVTTEGGIPEDAMTELKAKALDRLQEARAVLGKRMEDIASRTGDPNIPRSDLVDKALREEKQINGRDLLSEVRDLQSIVGTSRERLRYTGKGAPITDEQGVVRAPGTVKEASLQLFRDAYATFQKPLRQLPDDATFEKHVQQLERRATFLKTIAKKLSDQGQKGFVGEGDPLQKLYAQALATLAPESENFSPKTTINASGESAASAEALNRMESERQQGSKRIRIDTRSNMERPLIGPDAVDAVAGPYDRIVQRFADGREVVLDEGRSARPWFPRQTNAQRGAVSGAELMATSTVGAATGGAIGYRVAGPTGALVGSAAGFVGGFALPALYRMPAVANVLTSLGKEIRDLGFDTYSGTRDVSKGLVNFLSPTMGVNPEKLDPLMEMKGDIEASKRAAANALDVYRKHVDGLGRDAQIDFIDRYKQGAQQATPELQALANTIREIDKQNYDKIALFRPNLPFLENHFRLLYKTLPGGDEGFQGWLGKRPLAGTKGFLHQHVYDTLSDAMANGGEPITTNPVDLFLLGHNDVARFVHANMYWENLKANGGATFVKNGADVPTGYVPLDDKIAKVYFPARSGEGMVSPGQYYVDPQVGRLLGNYLSRDAIRANILGRKIVDFKNISNGWELFGGFHAHMMNAAAVVQNMNLAVQRMYNLGVRGGNPTEFLQGVRDLVSSPIELVKGNRPAWMEGKALEEYGKALDRSKYGDAQAVPTFLASDRGQELMRQYPHAEDLLRDASTGGLNFKMADDLRSNITKNMLQAFVDKRYISGMAKAPLSALYEANKPLFEWYIPRLKLGMFMRDMSLQLQDRADDLMSGKLTRGELARDVVNRTENIFGEMNFDNRFWNKTFKTAMQLFYRSVTWRLGTGKVLGGGLYGQGREVVNAVKQGELPRLDPNFGFIAGALLTLGTTAAVIQKIATGQNPQNMADLTHPKTGGVNENGKPNRINIPGYGTEFTKIADNPVKYAVGGRSGWLDRLYESWNNKDFYGKYVASPDDSKLTQFAVRALHVMAPQMIIASNINKLVAEGQTGWSGAAAGVAGFSPASKQIDMSPAELKAQEVMVRNLPQGGKGEAETARSQAIASVLRAIRNKQDAREPIRAGFKTGSLRPQDLDVNNPYSIPSRLQEPYLKQLLSGDRVRLLDILSVYDVANQQERAILKPMLAQKVLDLKKMDVATRNATIPRLKAAFSAR